MSIKKKERKRGGGRKEGGINKAKLKSLQLFQPLKRLSGSRSGHCN